MALPPKFAPNQNEEPLDRLGSARRCECDLCAHASFLKTARSDEMTIFLAMDRDSALRSGRIGPFPTAVGLIGLPFGRNGDQ